MPGSQHVRGTPFGRYELLRKIAAGGMAEVYLARQWGEDGFFRDVVIKRLFRNLAENSTTLRMFQYEAHLLANLSHPNIPQVHDLGFADGLWYLAMEFVEGWTVADVWRAGARRGHRMPLPVTLGVTMQVCEALHHAHTARDRAGRKLRIVHRDVTPHNVMMTRDGVAKLMDFGVAKTDARMETQPGTVKGTFAYMAPEQVQGKEVDPRADVFALGVILYELSTGTRLFRGNDMQVMAAIVEQDAPTPTSRVPDYPDDLEEIVMAALRRNPRSRIQSAADFTLHLEHFAMRRGLMVGPRAIAEYIGDIIPSQKVIEESDALVGREPSRSYRLPDDLPVTEPISVESGSDLVSISEGDQLSDDDIESLDPDEDRESAPPQPFAGFDDPDSTSSRPVVLLDKKKEDPEEGPTEGDYVSELEKRLGLDDED